MKILVPILALLLCLVPWGAFGAPPKSRPFAGNGLLVVRPLSPEPDASVATIALYRSPGVGRIRDMAASDFPTLAPVLAASDGEFVLAVLARKGDWLRVAYDDAGHEGWVALARPWRYLTWEELLKGRAVRLLPGLRKGDCDLHGAPTESSPQRDTLSRQRSLRIVQVDGDWALVLVDLAVTGWVRWRDGDGRFLIAVDNGSQPQNR